MSRKEQEIPASSVARQVEIRPARGPGLDIRPGRIRFIAVTVAGGNEFGGKFHPPGIPAGDAGIIGTDLPSETASAVK